MSTVTLKIALVMRGDFDEGRDYTPLDVVRYDNASYVFTAAKSAGDWDESKAQLLAQDGATWDEVSVIDGGDSSQTFNS